MANITRNFIKGRMNKSVDERLIPDGEYVDAINVRMGSTENSEIGVIENTKGNDPLTSLQYNGVPLSSDAKCIGAFEDGANETIYWFIHDSNYPVSTELPTGKLDLIVSFNTSSNQTRYHIISVNDGSDLNNTTINFNPKYLITGVDKVNDLLFFTDNINPPRFINVKRNYPNPKEISNKFLDYNGTPAILKEEIQVIKKPPLYAPSVVLKRESTEETYLGERYICFAYRYRYADNDYSATSPFTDPAFEPGSFNLSSSSYLNEGMVNQLNSASVTINTGGPLVKGIDLLFKNAQDSTIKVIEKINKLNSGLGDNNDYTFDFNNSNVFTILPVSEILRLYDNVPKFALGQTILGNRLIYGNYIDGYNLKRGLNPTIVEYSVDLITTDNPLIDSSNNIQTTLYYNTSNPAVFVSVPQSAIYFTFTDIVSADLVKGAVFVFDFTIESEMFESNLPAGATLTGTPITDLTFVFELPKNYSSVYDMASSDEFASSVGRLSPINIEPIYDGSGLGEPTSCDGITFTDDFNCALPESQATTAGTTVTKYVSGTRGDLLSGPTPWLNRQPIQILFSANVTLQNRIGFRFPYMVYVLDVANPQAANSQVTEFYSIITGQGTLQNSGQFQSLHSNRNYEIGMLYMDEFGRSTTGITSETNTVSIPCRNSVLKNSINVTIPIQQIAPEWATNYKFVIKPDEENYDVIYSNIYYTGSADSMLYFLLDGENSRKVEEGDRLIVKSDSLGATQSCMYATVLEKGSYASDAIVTGNVPGVYMKINPNSINVTQDPNAIVDYGKRTYYSQNPGGCAIGSYPAVIPGTTNLYDLPTGTIVEINLLFNRNGTGRNSCGGRRWYLNTTMTATRDYDNLYAFFEGENFQAVLNTGTSVVDGIIDIQTIWNGDTPPSPNCLLDRNYIWWDNLNKEIDLSGAQSCTGGTGNNKIGTIEITLKVNRISRLVIFETEPQDALSDVWFESSDTYTIDADGYHQGNEQTQTASQPAIINTDFYNCFAFGNGAESYKIRDSIVGNTFNLGNRVVTTSEQEYKEAHRYADLTYSGVYNEENNVNKLNEFNLGLLNFKPLEQSFGPIQKLFGRETDILTLQEDRISYVLQGKNLLSDAGAGSALTSVPEVLGTQIARIEEYGISNNPESFVQWGSSKFFTDAKRGAVIQLKGTSAQNEQLAVISEQGMRSWFRDLFIDSFGTQKIGGYDPYMGEYVLTSNEILKPLDTECDSCGLGIVFETLQAENTSYCVDVGQFVGDINIDYAVVEGTAGFNISANYNGTAYDTGIVTTGGTLTFPKQSVSEQFVYITVSSNGKIRLEVTVNCPDAEVITILNVCVTGDDEQGVFIHNEYRWTDGAFVSPLHSNSVQFASGTNTPLVSQYQSVIGQQGAGVIPSDTASVQIISNKIGSDNFVFDETSDRFRYLRTNTLYNNNDTEIQALLAASTTATPIINTGAPTTYSANFNMPSTGSYLYLIWDYRTITEIDLCSGSTISDACCGC